MWHGGGGGARPGLREWALFHAYALITPSDLLRDAPLQSFFVFEGCTLCVAITTLFPHPPIPNR